MATEAEEKQAIDEICEIMSDVAIGDQVKREVASAALVMECCFAAAEDMIDRAAEERGYTWAVHEVALALFDSVVKRSLMAQTQGPLQILPAALLEQLKP